MLHISLVILRSPDLREHLRLVLRGGSKSFPPSSNAGGAGEAAASRGDRRSLSAFLLPPSPLKEPELKAGRSIIPRLRGAQTGKRLRNNGQAEARKGEDLETVEALDASFHP